MGLSAMFVFENVLCLTFLDVYASNVPVSYMQERDISQRRDVCLSRTVQVGCAISLICRFPSYLYGHYELFYLPANTNSL